jgi:hypothetical protein
LRNEINNYIAKLLAYWIGGNKKDEFNKKEI